MELILIINIDKLGLDDRLSLPGRPGPRDPPRHPRAAAAA
jgi:hypothetical protein